VLVTHDMLGLFDRHTPKFVRQYAQIGEATQSAFEKYKADVKARKFPSDEHTYTMPDEAWEAISAGRAKAQNGAKKKS